MNHEIVIPKMGKCRADTEPALSNAEGSAGFDFAWSVERTPSPATFEGLPNSILLTILSSDRQRLQDVSSGYWTLPFKQTSGLVSHYGSIPSSSARPLVLDLSVVIMILLDRQRTYWFVAQDDCRGFCFLRAVFFGPCKDWGTFRLSPNFCPRISSPNFRRKSGRASQNGKRVVVWTLLMVFRYRPLILPKTLAPRQVSRCVLACVGQTKNVPILASSI